MALDQRAIGDSDDPGYFGFLNNILRNDRLVAPGRLA
jgi:hypothetical protein